MTLPGAPVTAYYLVINNPLGQRLFVCTDYIRIEVTRVVSGLGSLVFYLPGGNYDDDDLPVDGIVELWRAPLNGSPVLFLDALWFIRDPLLIFQNGDWIWKVTCYDLLYLIGDPDSARGRVIPYNTGNDFTNKLDYADDMCKAVMRENVGSLATDTDRDLSAYLSIAADNSLGALVHKEFAHRLVLTTLQEICQASIEATGVTPVYVAFDIVCTVPPSSGSALALQFQTFIGQRGQDHRASSVDPVLIGPDFSNMDNAELGRSHTAEANYIYALGQGIADTTAVLTASDAARIGISPWNRREFIQSAQDTADLEALQFEADSALRAGRPRRTLTGRLLDTDQARFGIDWSWGDYLTAQARGISFDCRAEVVAVTFDRDGGESIAVSLVGDHDE